MVQQIFAEFNIFLIFELCHRQEMKKRHVYDLYIGVGFCRRQLGIVDSSTDLQERINFGPQVGKRTRTCEELPTANSRTVG
jgi:hypothetical protein